MPLSHYQITSFGAPVQIQGRLKDDRWFYFRARHRKITLGIADTWDLAVATITIGFSMDGFPDDVHPLSSFSEDHALNLLTYIHD